MMTCRRTIHLLIAALLAAGVAGTGCAKRQLTRGEAGRLEILADRIAQAEAAGARECAPRELARAKVALEHARAESSETDEQFEEALAEAEKAVYALTEKMKTCGKEPPGAGPVPSPTGAGAKAPSDQDNRPAPGPSRPSETTTAPGQTPPLAVSPGDASQPAPYRPGPVPAKQKDEGSFENIHFDFDESFIREDAKPILLGVADYMKKHPSARLTLEGHCDERGTSEYNMALGQRRADAARKYLVTLGVAAGRLTTVSFGKERPLFPGHDEESWAGNRRAVFVLAP